MGDAGITAACAGHGEGWGSRKGAGSSWAAQRTRPCVTQPPPPRPLPNPPPLLPPPRPPRPPGDRPYLISGADDRLVKVWDYQTKACIQTLDGHAHNVSTVAFHPELPLIITGASVRAGGGGGLDRVGLFLRGLSGRVCLGFVKGF